ncbi:MAG: POTRA domain-containing protein [Raineya sp.]|nr:POTRA domain-containing protein [Raineya sp.]
MNKNEITFAFKKVVAENNSPPLLWRGGWGVRSILFFLYFPQILVAQITLQLYFQPSQNFSYQTQFPDSLSCERYLQNFLQNLQRKGYWYAQISQKTYQNKSLTAYIQIGEPIVWQKLHHGNVENDFLEKIRLSNLQNQNFDYAEVQKIMQKILTNAENKGYPFAQVRLDSLQIIGNKISATLQMQKGFFVTWDTLHLKGNLKIKRKFLEKYLQIQKNEPYNHQKLQKAERLLKNLGFVLIYKPTEVVFENQQARAVFYLNQGQSNAIDGILGFMPNELAPQQLLLTGQAQIRLRNLFNSAKSLELEFQQTKPRHQILNVFYKHPVLFGSRLQGEFDFRLLREDTNFINVYRSIRFAYPLNEKSFIKFFGGWQTSQTGFTPKPNGILPPTQETRYNFYGLGYEWNSTDNLFLPKNGLQLIIQSQTGNKKIIPIPFLPDTLYEGIQLNSLQTAVEMQIHYYKMFSRRSGIYGRLAGAKLFNPNLVQNELYRLGGLLNLRGFNQNFFFASSYLLGTAEYRFFWEEEAYFFFFYDQAFLQTQILRTRNQEIPFGIGAGISFRTKGGIFNLTYALGKSQTQNLSVAKSKVHFGFTSRF